MLLLQKTLYQLRDLGGRNIIILYAKIKIEFFLVSSFSFMFLFHEILQKLEKRDAGGFKN